ncbi:hypothetical protein PG989_002368 [Apiospora arundinis]
MQWIQGWLGHILTSSTANLPHTKGEDARPAIVTHLPNALYFQRGIQNKRVRDIEFQIPIPAHKDNPSRPDFTEHCNGPLGIASIEVLAIPDADRDGEWADCVQRMSDVWMSCTDSDGAKLNVGPHWAKEWDELVFEQHVLCTLTVMYVRVAQTN